MARRGARNFTRSGGRPNRGWNVTAFAAYTTIPAASKVLLGSFALTNVGVDQTILRVIGLLSVASDQVSNNEQQIGAVGLILVTDIALAAGIASIPGAFSEGEDDGWFAHFMFNQSSVAAGAAPASREYVVESKAKRIWSGTGIVLAIVGENAHATHGLDLIWNFRMLTQVRGTR